jgi:hypothetical protein
MAMTKVIMNLGYNEYILGIQDAVTVMEIMTKAEKYKAKYTSGDYTHHVWDNQGDNPITFIKPINENLYRTAKLAGEPKDD